MSTWKTLTLQDSTSPLMEQLIFFHDHSLMILIIITILISQIMLSYLLNKFNHRFFLQNQTMELIWTIMPIMILIMIALPSLRLLYIMDELNKPALSIKIIGHQWYWTYEYSDLQNFNYDSYMIPQNNFNFRLLDVDNRMVIPFNTYIRLLITSEDVIHSWALPSAGLKIDATPGRLNQANMFINRTGIFFGQCSEICGSNHSFMPIVVESISSNFFLKWLKNN
nr:cytochrome c oxidase subunit 2 [Cylas formicarius]WGU49412.1 cytochrome c oxidase subunit 2 [Cylas formicarius]WGU49425.1 cytochrome c oxidase subunit 2 [Cylas formicarius]WGU49438.1 cytochrome c oxidase subunit 2 [Cylas formicarius]WGU49451.1 cytochrome c oxidase subunit 2 [Cylas formicarius]